MQVVRSIHEMREALSPVRRQGEVIGLVPTMGALHRGHGALIGRAHEGSDHVVVSIFVNPIQFNRDDDYNRYPRPLDADLEFCRQAGVHAMFAPTNEEMYPHPLKAFVDVKEVGDRLCGEFRPGHFRGVATVVLKLFQIVQPDRAYFGEKDAQQLAVIRTMVDDLNVPVAIVPVPTVREDDGLALSSRNQLLDPEQRRGATVLYRALRQAAAGISGGMTEPGRIRSRALSALEKEPQCRVEYLEVVDPGSMQPVDRVAGPVLLIGAIWMGSVRLIDNLLCEPHQGAEEHAGESACATASPT